MDTTQLENEIEQLVIKLKLKRSKLQEIIKADVLAENEKYVGKYFLSGETYFIKIVKSDVDYLEGICISVDGNKLLMKYNTEIHPSYLTEEITDEKFTLYYHKFLSTASELFRK